MQVERSWIKALACCARSDDDDRHEIKVEAAPSDLTFDQPRLVARPQYPRSLPRPATSHSVKAQQWLTSGRASFSAARRPWTSHSHRRMKIGEPTDFRRVDDMPKRRHSFSPLELSIYKTPGCRLSPLPDFCIAKWGLIEDLQKPAAAVLAEDNVVEHLPDAYSKSIGSSNSHTVPRKPLSTTAHGLNSHQRYGSYGSSSTEIVDEGPMAMAAYELRSGPDALPASIMVEPLPAAVRPESYRARPRAFSSAVQTPTAGSRSGIESSSRSSSIRRVRSDVDEAIRELNRIVEERRTNAVRAAARGSATKTEPRVSQTSTPELSDAGVDVSPLSPDMPVPHVPAIVPTMKVHVRSETLSDIGSAFSTPLISKSLPTPPSVAAADADSPADSLPSHRWELNIDTRGTEPPYGASTLRSASPLSAASARSRLSGWLRKSVVSPLASGRDGTELCNPAMSGYNHTHMGSAPNICSSIPAVHEGSCSGRSSATLPVSSRTGSPDAASPPRPGMEGRGKLASNVPSAAAHLGQRGGKATMTARRRGLSVGIVNGVPPPPAYEVVDPHPKSATSPAGPRAIGLAY